MATEISLRLAITILQNEVTALKEENRRLKDTLQTMCLNEYVAMVKTTRGERWAFYHKHKAAIRAEYGLMTRQWREVKRLTDELYNKQR